VWREGNQQVKGGKKITEWLHSREGGTKENSSRKGSQKNPEKKIDHHQILSTGH